MGNNHFQTNLEYYKIFYTAVSAGSITQAAQDLYLTQPTVTKAIQKLEEQLGCTLFQRSRHGISLTRDGRLLWDRVQPACQLLLSGERELRSSQTLESGSLSIVSTEMSFRSYILPGIERFAARYPGVKIRFMNALNPRMVELLQSGRADLAVVHEPFDRSHIRVLSEIDTIQEEMVVGPKYAFLAERVNRPETLTQYPFVSMPAGSSTRTYMEKYFQRSGVPFEPDIELTTIELALQAVLCNLGIGILPRRVLDARQESGKLFRVNLAEPLPPRTACLICADNIPLSAAAAEFANRFMLSGTVSP